MFSPDWTLISASAAAHCGISERDSEGVVSVCGQRYASNPTSSFSVSFLALAYNFEHNERLLSPLSGGFQYQIKDMGLLLKCGFVLVVVLVFFFMYSFVSSVHLGLGELYTSLVLCTLSYLLYTSLALCCSFVSGIHFGLG